MARLYILFSLLLCWGFSPQLHAQNSSACLPGETCDDAPLFCGYALNNFTAELPLVPTNFGTTFGCSTEIAWHNSHWFRIIPCASQLQLTFDVLSSQTGNGIQIALYHGCNDLNVVACDPGQQSGAFLGPLVLYANVVPGVEYLLQVDGFEADVCDYQITVQSGLNIEQPIAPGNAVQNGYIEGPSVVCAGGGPYTYTAHLPICTGGQGGCNATEQACTRYNWNIPPGATVIGDATNSQITLDFSNATGAAISFSTYSICNWCQDCVPAGGGCNGVIEPKDITVIQSQTIHLGVVQICAGETYEVCGTVFDTTGSYTIVCPNTNGCGDTIYFTLVYNPACAPTMPCNHLNQPAAPGDSCSVAPLFCGNYLEGYCSSNAGASPDSSFNTNGAPCFSIENNVWLRIPPCSADVKLEITPVNCSTWNGLEAALFSGVCDSMNLVGNCQTLPPNQADTLIFNGLDSGEVYWLMIDGVQGDECQFSVHVVDGFGTASIPSYDCDCTPGSISGPADLCAGDVAMYTLTLPHCTITPDTIIGGNGYSCAPPVSVCGGTPDSTVIIWHIPKSLQFVGDSTGLTITVVADSSLIGKDTLIMDSIWVEIKNIADSTDLQVDSLAFCDCASSACLAPTVVPPAPVTIQHKVLIDQVTLTCNQPDVTINNQSFSITGTYIVSQNNCETHKVIVQSDFTPPSYGVNLVDNFDGTYSVVVSLFSQYDQVIGLGGTQNSNTITSSPIPCGTPYSFTVVNFINGCSEFVSGTFQCACLQPFEVNLTAIGTISCCTPFVPIETQTIPPLTGLTYKWQGPGVTGSNSPSLLVNQQGVYALTVTGSDGCVAKASAIVYSNLQKPGASVNPTQPICIGESATLYAGSPTPNAFFNWDNGANSPSISVTPSQTSFYAVTVTNPVNCCTSIASASVAVNQLTVQNKGVVGAVTCSQTCFTYNGQTYCTPGNYQQTANCTQTNFSIVFARDTIQLGIVDTLTCAHHCFTFNGIQYCTPGNYSIQDSCNVYNFTLASIKDTVQLGILDTLSCVHNCFTFNGIQYCTPGNYNSQDSCNVYYFTLAGGKDTVQLGILDTLSCAHNCFTFNGIQYCTPGNHSSQDNCNVYYFTLASGKDTVQLGIVDTLTCLHNCFTFNGIQYCTPGNYNSQDSCNVYYFSVIENKQPPLVSDLLEMCNPSGTAYLVSFQITGQPPFLVNDTPVSGNYFSSSPIASGDTYAYIVKSAPNSCESTTSGHHNCDYACVATAGQMEHTILHQCVQESAQGQYLGGAQFGPNDLAQFILHDQAGAALGLVIAKNQTGNFNFIPGLMQTEQLYYISQIVGKSDGNGNVDLTDPCLSVAIGQPIIFHATPTAAISGTAQVCFGEPLSLLGSGGTSGFWVMPNNTLINTNVLNLNANDIVQAADYRFVADNNFGCRDTAHIEVTVIAEIIKPKLTIHQPQCPNPTPVQGAVEIKAGAANLQFSLDNGPLQSVTQFDHLDVGSHILTTQDQYGCTRNDSVYIYEPAPLAVDAGPDQTTYPGAMIHLKGTYTGIPVDIQWVASDGQTFSNNIKWDAQFGTSSLVTLSIMDHRGCKAQDELRINIQNGDYWYIPNAIAPESLEGNAYFTVFCVEGFVKNIAALRIFDRWGNMLFERNGFQPNIPNLGWDGSTGGKYALPGAYVYIVELDLFDGTQKTLNGSLTVVR